MWIRVGGGGGSENVDEIFGILKAFLRTDLFYTTVFQNGLFYSQARTTHSIHLNKPIKILYACQGGMLKVGSSLKKIPSYLYKVFLGYIKRHR